MPDRYNSDECGHFVALLEVSFEGAKTVSDWSIAHISHDYIRTQRAYDSFQDSPRQCGVFFGFRNHDGLLSVHSMHAKDVCILIDEGKVLCGSLLELPAAVEAAIAEINAAVPYTPKKEG